MYAEKPVVLPFFTGYVSRGLLLHVVREVDPSASGLLHELNVSKPYSVTPLRFRSSSRVESGYTGFIVSLPGRFQVFEGRVFDVPA
jgi:hypothetical protein